MLPAQHLNCVTCASVYQQQQQKKKSSHTSVFPQKPCYLLANSCLNTTQVPIKIPKTKNYYSRHSGAKHYFEKLFMNVQFRLHNMNSAKINKKTPQFMHFQAVVICPYVCTSVTSADANTRARAQSASVCASLCDQCVLSVKGSTSPYGALVLELWGECRSCHYN